MINKEKLRRRFSRNAKQYDKYANVQKKMGDYLVERVRGSEIEIKNVLEVGCGTGYVTKLLAELLPEAEITAVDIAPGMIDLVKGNLEGRKINFLCGDIEAMEIETKYDLIISNATFQWFNELDGTIAKLVNSLTEKGKILFSTFGENTFNELHSSFGKAKEALALEDSVSPGQGFFSLDALRDVCTKSVDEKGCGVVTIHSDENYEYEKFDSCKEFLISVKKIGANKSDSSKSNATPEFIGKVMEIYDNDYRDEENRVRATYHNLFIEIAK